MIREGKIANYHPYPPTPWNASPRDSNGTPGPYEDAVQNTPLFEENSPENFKGIDIMRTVRSFDPCLPCGVHMYLGNGRVLETHHSPMFGAPAKSGEPRGAYRDCTLERSIETVPVRPDSASRITISSRVAVSGSSISCVTGTPPAAASSRPRDVM